MSDSKNPLKKLFHHSSSSSSSSSKDDSPRKDKATAEPTVTVAEHPSTPAHPPPEKHTTNDAHGKPLPAAAYKWGITPTPETDYDNPPPDHPVHKISEEQQAKWRKKGINPVLRAEMDEALNKGEGKGMWAKVPMTMMGPGGAVG